MRSISIFLYFALIYLQSTTKPSSWTEIFKILFLLPLLFILLTCVTISFTKCKIQQGYRFRCKSKKTQKIANFVHFGHIWHTLLQIVFILCYNVSNCTKMIPCLLIWVINMWSNLRTCTYHTFWDNLRCPKTCSVVPKLKRPGPP